MRSFISFLQSMSLLAVRIGFGLLLIAHAWHRWHTVGMHAEIAHLQAFDVPQPYLLAWGTLALEALGGVMLVFGLLVPLVALTLLVMNILIIVWIKWGNGLYIHHDGWEFNAVQAGLALLLTTFGSGRAGLDALVFGRHTEDNERIAVRDIP
ncbi:DoxX family protein [Luteococcus sp. Sow4_B9]|uniref:DoxX family protein n=1 Tax=Luteococcus sp. Sow4_B9 TaxID=3438792 RepID=UPI003F9D3C25